MTQFLKIRLISFNKCSTLIQNIQIFHLIKHFPIQLPITVLQLRFLILQLINVLIFAFILLFHHPKFIVYIIKFVSLFPHH